ncbi:helix-turn-helix domain-containing protein [Actinophytocola sp.]|uniref:helix-turn-helix domain-containing protein n=1 Tax=Actinophytocola sp. TaxID=1872138 RepID=UPI00389AB8F0
MLDRAVCKAVGYELRVSHTSQPADVVRQDAYLPPEVVASAALAHERGNTQLNVIRLTELSVASGISPACVIDQAMQRIRAFLGQLWTSIYGRVAATEIVGGPTFQPGERSDTSWLYEMDLDVIDQTITAALRTVLRETRRQSGFKQDELVALMPSGIGVSTLNAYESGTQGVLVSRLVELGCVMRRPPGDIVDEALVATRRTLTRSVEAPAKNGRRRVWDDDEAQQVAAKYRKGMSLRALAKTSGHSYGTVRNMILSTGTPLRGRGGRHRTRPQPASG